MDASILEGGSVSSLLIPCYSHMELLRISAVHPEMSTTDIPHLSVTVCTCEGVLPSFPTYEKKKAYLESRKLLYGRMGHHGHLQKSESLCYLQILQQRSLKYLRVSADNTKLSRITLSSVDNMVIPL